MLKLHSSCRYFFKVKGSIYNFKYSFIFCLVQVTWAYLIGPPLSVFLFIRYQTFPIDFSSFFFLFLHKNIFKDVSLHTKLWYSLYIIHPERWLIYTVYIFIKIILPTLLLPRGDPGWERSLVHVLLACRTRWLNGAVLRMRPRKPTSRVTACMTH